MIDFFYISLSIYFGLGCFVLLGYILQLKNEKKRSGIPFETISLEEVVVIIPFRNEEHRLSSLIQSINQQKIFPKKILFIDDHSTDNGKELIQKLSDFVPYEILSLPSDSFGKKSAIRFGVNFISTEYNLTWDADIQLPSDYFETLQTLPKADLLILPIIMKGKTISELFFEADHAMANAMNIATDGLTRPFIASGANLLFHQAIFLQIDSIKHHAHIASGDDMFLLKDFRENKSHIQLSSNKSIAVTTETPKSWKEFMSQRLRWIGKSSNVKDHLSTTLALLVFVFNTIFYTGFVLLIYDKNWSEFLLVFGLKSLIDWIVYAPYFLKYRRIVTWLLLPVFSFIQPIYLLVLLGLMAIHKPSWKGRKINIK